MQKLISDYYNLEELLKNFGKGPYKNGTVFLLIISMLYQQLNLNS